VVTTLRISTTARTALLDVTGQVQQAVRESGIKNGICLIFVPHTTAGITINENADPDVKQDILTALDRLIPARGDYRHLEGNSPAHIKASLVGSSLAIPVEDGRLVLGTWQGITFCEFDGPRQRNLVVKILAG